MQLDVCRIFSSDIRKSFIISQLRGAWSFVRRRQ